MIFECSCGKMFRVRDDAANPPSKCPACGGALRRAGGGAAPPAAVALSTELGAALENATSMLRLKEHDLEEARARLASLETELAEARQSIARLGDDQARAQESHLAALRSKEEDLARERARAEQLSEAPSRVLGLQADLAEARQCIARLGDDQARAQAAHLEAIRSKDSEIERLSDRVPSLERQVEEARGGESLEGRVAELEEELARVLASLERETAERRRAEEHASKLVTDQARTIEDKEAIIATLEATLASRAGAMAGAGAGGASALPPPVLAEALHLVSEVDRSLDSLAAQFGALRERARRVGECLGRVQVAAPPPEVSAPAPVLPEGSPAEPASADIPAIQAAEPEEPAKLALPADESLLEMSGLAEKVRQAISGKTEAAEPAPQPPPQVEEASFTEVEPEAAGPASSDPGVPAGESRGPLDAAPVRPFDTAPSFAKAPEGAQGKKGFFKKLFGK